MTERKSSFEDLECWKAGRSLKELIRRDILPKFPAEEKYSLNDQLKRAMRSITVNIAEGNGRYHYMDEAKFLINSRGSAHELLDRLIEAFDGKYISEADLNQVRDKVHHFLRLLNGYRSYIVR